MGSPTRTVRIPAPSEPQILLDTDRLRAAVLQLVRRREAARGPARAPLRGNGYPERLKRAIVAYVRSRKQGAVAYAEIARRIAVPVATFWPWIHGEE